MRFMVPRYFAGFKCKMGECRSACCVGWPVTVSMKNYFTLLGMPCRKELRDRLDCAVRMVDHPTEEEYARFSPNWLGDCPMRMEDGRCSIHAELGEEVLSDVCRLYPRGVRLWEGRYECSASGSCEKTLELLWDEEEPMTFAEEDLDVTPPPHPGSPSAASGLPLSEELRFALIGVMQDRSMRVGDRILGMRPLLGLGERAPSGNGISAAVRVLEYYAERSDSIRDAGEEIEERYGQDPGLFLAEAEAFDRRFPEWERFLEQMLTNHMFFTQFPWIGVGTEEALTSLAVIYGLLRVLAVGSGARERDGVVDICAAAFRLIAHTPFERSVTAALGGLDGYALTAL